VITITVIILVIIGYFGSVNLLNTARVSMADKKGKAFISKLYKEYTILGSSCQGEDTDRDLYVSCDYRITNSSGLEKVVHLQCPVISKIFTGASCKESRVFSQ
jgi:hypothetical protein